MYVTNPKRVIQVVGYYEKNVNMDQVMLTSLKFLVLNLASHVLRPEELCGKFWLVQVLLLQNRIRTTICK